MQCPFQQIRVGPEFLSFLVQPVGCETNFANHNFDPLTSHFLKIEKLMGYLIALYFFSFRLCVS